jgi:NAD+ dependent glucose-6-phosphate dehydrogenase
LEIVSNDPQRKTVLITGATGSIGGKVRRHLSALGGFDLRLLCINPSNDPEVMTADLADYDERWACQFEAVDAVLHLAGASSPISSWATVQRLNLDLSLNVLRAAERYGARRIVFASSNWVLAGHRCSDVRLTPELAPWPVNPYGGSKLSIERAGLDWVERTGRSFIAFRIGYCQHAPGNIPGPHMDHGVWGQQMWLSDRDLCHGMERAVLAHDVRFAVLNLMSDNPGMRWDIDETRRVIGYQPQDGHRAVSTPGVTERDRLACAAGEVVEQLRWLSGKW